MSPCGGLDHWIDSRRNFGRGKDSEVKIELCRHGGVDIKIDVDWGLSAGQGM
jgi:hypothetical protein